MTTLTAYRVSNRASANILGIFLAADHEGALDALAVAAGYKSRADIPDEIRADEDDLIVENVDGDIDFVVDFVVDGMKQNKDSNAGSSYADWNDGAHARDTYCDFSMCDEDELTLDQKRIKEILEDDAMIEIIDDRISAWLAQAVVEEFKDAVLEAEDLEDLRDALISADEYAKTEGIDSADIYDAAAIPTFSDSVPQTVWSDRPMSYDDDRLLIHQSMGWTIVPR